MVNYNERLDRTFAALVDPTRLAILARLEREHGASISALAQPFVIKLPAVMKHLDVLYDAGLRSRRVACRDQASRDCRESASSARSGRRPTYSLNEYFGLSSSALLPS